LLTIQQRCFSFTFFQAVISRAVAEPSSDLAFIGHRFA
jgi:hypothetical protein